MSRTLRSPLFSSLAGLVLLSSADAAGPSVQELIAAAKTGAESARLEAIDQLAAPGDQADAAVAALAQLLTDKSPAVRARAAHSLGKIGAPAKKAAEALHALLKDGDETVRRQAVGALVAIRPGPQVMLPLSIRLMEDSDPAVRMRILHAVSEAGEPAVPGLIEALANERAAYWACLVLRDMGPTGKAAVPALARTLKSQDAETRREALLALGAMQEEAAPVLDQIAANLDDEQTRTAATFALGQIGRIPPAAEPKIRQNAKSEDKILSSCSLWTLARIHPDDKQLLRDAIEQLVARLKDEDPLVRVAAARALGALPSSPEISLPIFEKAMAGADEATVHHALDALAFMGPPAVPRLINALKHEKLRANVAYVLGQMGADAAPASEALSTLVADKDARVAAASIHALAKIGPGAKDAVPALLAAWEQDSPHAHAIVYALGQIGPGAAAAEPQLMAALASQDRALAVVSAWALTRIRPGSRDAATKAMPVLTAGLADSLPHTRQAAAEALGSLGPLAKDALPALEKASQDSQESVRAAATQALRQIRG